MHPDSVNVQVVLEYRGVGEAAVSTLRLGLGHEWVEGSVLPRQQGPKRADVDWVRSQSVALKSLEAGAPSEDLDRLAPILGDARFILLGESTHGTHEFFTLKHRIVDWLAEREGEIVFAIEDHDAPARAIDRFVQTGEGDPEALVGSLFGFWGRREVVDLVLSLRRKVQEGRASISFVGVDLQVPLGALDSLEAFAREYDSELQGFLSRSVGAMRAAWQEGWYPQRSPEELEEWERGARSLIETLEARLPHHRRLAGPESADQARYDARLILQSVLNSRSEDFRVRDRLLAENLADQIGRRPAPARVVVWAHNTHVRLDEGAMGEHLERLFPGEIVSLGFFTQKGRYLAYDGSQMREYALFPGPIESVEYLLSQAGEPISVLDLRKPGPSPFTRPLLHRNIGLFPADLGLYRAVMTEGFHGLVFVGETTPTRPIR